MNSIIHFDPTALGRPLTLEELEMLARGEASVLTRGHRGTPRTYRLNAEQLRLYAQAKTQGFFFDRPERVAWLAQWWLETTQQPCLRIRPRGKTATVSMDLISMRREDSDAWTGTRDRNVSDELRSSHASRRRDHSDALKEQPIFLPNGAKSIDQTTLRQLAQICVDAYLGDLLLWRGSFWKFDGACRRPTSKRWESFALEAWEVLHRVVHADGSYFLPKMRDMRRIVQEARRLVPEVTGEPPFWVEPRDTDPDAKHCIVRSRDIFDFRSREAHPLSSRLFVTMTGAGDLVRQLALAAGASPRGHYCFGVYTAVERVPIENAASFAAQLRDLYWRVVGKNPPDEKTS